MNMSQPRIVVGIAVLGVLLCVLLCGIYFQFSYFEPDTVSYRFQAKLFARGKLSFPAPPEMGFSSSPHVNIFNGKWYSKYPFGNALMLTLGEWAHAPWLVPAIATGLFLLLLYAIVRDVYDDRAAMIAVLVGLISPATLGMGCTWFSESVSRLCLALYLLGLFRMLRDGHRGYAVLSGFALGYAFNTRPMPAVAFGIAGGVLALVSLVQDGRRALFTRRLLLFLAPFALWLGICAAWNTHFTGNPLKFTHTIAQPHDRIGFGKRTEGYEPSLDHAFNFTPQWAVERLWRHTLPSISYYTLGWGRYRPDLLRASNESARSNPRFLLDALPLLLPLALMLLPLLHPSRNRYDFLFLSLLVLQLALYFPFYFEGSTWGSSPVNARYYNECTLLGIVPLIARGILIVWGWCRRKWQRVLQPALVVLLLLLCVNTVYTYVWLAPVYQNWGAVYQKLPRLVKQEGLQHAVVFVPNHRGAPIGDYPFQDLDRANIVYFKLGPAPAWGLNRSDWHGVYEEYFDARDAYLYEHGRLTPLVQTGIIPSVQTE